MKRKKKSFTPKTASSHSTIFQPQLHELLLGKYYLLLQAMSSKLNFQKYSKNSNIFCGASVEKDHELIKSSDDSKSH